MPVPETPLVEIFSECEGWEGCITHENSGKLLRYWKARDRWARQMEIACSETPPGLDPTTEGNE